MWSLNRVKNLGRHHEMGEDMELTLRMAAIETILFAMGDSVEMSVIAQALEITEEEAEEAVDALEKRCQSPDRF